MSTKIPISKETLDIYLKELGKRFRKLNGIKMTNEIILIGGASVLINYGFRDMTYDADAIIMASSAIKEAINYVRDKFGLPHGWLNADFKNTTSYSDKLISFSVYYKTFSNVLTIRTVAAEYLVAMKLMSGRQYKYDLSDIVGILWEHEKNNQPLDRSDIERAISELYGHQSIPDISQQFLDDVFKRRDYERFYREIRESEEQAKEILIEFEKDYPNLLNGANINSIIEITKRKKEQNNE